MSVHDCGLARRPTASGCRMSGGGQGGLRLANRHGAIQALTRRRAGLFVRDEASGPVPCDLGERDRSWPHRRARDTGISTALAPRPIHGGRGRGRLQPWYDLLADAEALLQVGEPGQDELVDAEPPVSEEFVGHLLRRADNGGSTDYP